MPQTIFMLPLQLLYIAHPNVFITENLNKESRDAKAQQLRYVTWFKKEIKIQFFKTLIFCRKNKSF